MASFLAEIPCVSARRVAGQNDPLLYLFAVKRSWIVMNFLFNFSFKFGST